MNDFYFHCNPFSVVVRNLKQIMTEYVWKNETKIAQLELNTICFVFDVCYDLKWEKMEHRRWHTQIIMSSETTMSIELHIRFKRIFYLRWTICQLWEYDFRLKW